MPSLEVRLLGGLDLRAAGEPLPPIPRTGRWLLSYLILHRRRPVPRERVAAVFWPDLPASRGRRRLSHTLWQIQDTLSEHPAAVDWLEANPTDLRLRPDRAWIDVVEFEQRLERLRPSSGSVPDWRRTDLAELADAVELYRGDLLPDLHEEWAEVERQRLVQLHLDALGWLVAMGKSQAAYEDALLYARRITNLEPLREDAHREVMRLCTLLGRPSDALRQYERAESVLREELGTEPARETQQLRRFIERHREVPQTVEVVPGDPARSVRLVGRDRERRTAVGALERSLGGEGGLVLIEGEPGIGKTRLVEEVADAARWRGFAVIAGGSDVGVRRPYGALVDALQDVLTPVRVEQLRPHVGRVWLSAAAEVVAPLARSVPPETVTGRLTGQASAERVREGLVKVMLALARIEPTLLILEDLHEADPETLAVVERLVRGLGREPLLLTVTFRSAEARGRPEVWRTLRTIDEVAAPDRIDLEPLSPFGLAELTRAWLGEAPPADLSARLHRETGGNPLFVLETLASIEHAGGVAGEAAADLPVAGSVRDVVAGRLEDLDETMRTTLRTAALQPSGTDLDLLIAALTTRFAPAAVAEHVSDLLGRGLLIEREGLRFRHEVLRRTVTDTIPEVDAPDLHRGIARALSVQQPHRVADIAAHLESGGEALEAAERHHEAGRAAVAIHAYETARHHLERAVDLARGGPIAAEVLRARLADLESVLDVLADRGRQSEVLAELEPLCDDEGVNAADAARRRAWLAWATDDFAAAEAAARRAMALAADDETRVDAGTALGRVLQAQGSDTEAVEVLRDTLAGVGSDPAPLAAPRAHLALGAVLGQAQGYDEALSELERAAALADLQGDVRSSADARTALGLIHAERGERDRALPHYREALERCREMGYRYGEAVALVNLALSSWDRPEAALDDLSTAATVFREMGNDRGVAIAHVNRAFVRHLDLADDAGAAADALEAHTFFRRIEDRTSAAVCAAIEARVAAARGDLPRAVQLVEDAAPAGDPRSAVELETARARMQLAAGAPEQAARTAAAASDAATRAGAYGQLIALADAHVEALLADGRADEAVAATDDVVALTPDHELERPHRLWWARYRALAAADRGDEAEVALTRAGSALEAVLATIDAPETRQACARVPIHAAILAAVDERERARRPLRLRLAARSAPTGRPLTASEWREVLVSMPSTEGGGDEPAVRRERIVRIVRVADEAGAICTVEDLADALGVSTSTVRRDLRHLRAIGHDVPTRGHRAS